MIHGGITSGARPSIIVDDRAWNNSTPETRLRDVADYVASDMAAARSIDILGSSSNRVLARWHDGRLAAPHEPVQKTASSSIAKTISTAIARERKIVMTVIGEELRPLFARVAGLEEQNRARSPSAERENGWHRGPGAAAVSSDEGQRRDAAGVPATGAALPAARTRVRLKTLKATA